MSHMQGFPGFPQEGLQFLEQLAHELRNEMKTSKQRRNHTLHQSQRKGEAERKSWRYIDKHQCEEVIMQKASGKTSEQCCVLLTQLPPDQNQRTGQTRQGVRG